jgi:hypothetical protein
MRWGSIAVWEACPSMRSIARQRAISPIQVVVVISRCVATVSLLMPFVSLGSILDTVLA